MGDNPSSFLETFGGLGPSTNGECESVLFESSSSLSSPTELMRSNSSILWNKSSTSVIFSYSTIIWIAASFNSGSN